MTLLCTARKILIAIFLVSISAVSAFSQQIPTPKSVLGFEPGDDRTIADWHQIVDYFKKLDIASPKVAVKEFGRSTNGLPMIAAFISSPANIRDLDKYRKISRTLADPRMISNDAEARKLAADGKTIVAISCSIHSTEIVASQMSMLLAYKLASQNDDETKQIIDNTILMLIPSPNPDGIQIVADWYRKTLGTPAEGTSPPELYHHYAGHDDNRDWFMMNLVETRAVTKLFWKEWFPQLVYDVHQQGQNASRFIIPPFFDPPNPRIAPTVLREVGLIGYKIAADLQADGVAGVATDSTYDTWWHGGFRSAPYFHNAIGILSEAASVDLMSPVKISADDLRKARPVRGLPSLTEPLTNFPQPWKGGDWRARDIMNIELTASISLLDMAAKFRRRYLYDLYLRAKDNLAVSQNDPQAFVITAGQPNAENVSRLLEILMWQGIEVYEMRHELYMRHDQRSNDFHEMPTGSFIVFTDQPQARNVLSLFERQIYPDRRLPNGDAEAPYDVAGWTLPLQMGVRSDPVWAIKDLEKMRPTLARLTSINDARRLMNLDNAVGDFAKVKDPLITAPRIGLYKGYTGSMDEGWTRFVFDTFNIPFKSVSDVDVRKGDLPFDSIVMPSDGENSIVKGLSDKEYPKEFAGGIGEAGVENLKRFVANGGTLICFDRSCSMVIKRFQLPIKNVVEDLKRSEFYDPGSVVSLDLAQNDRLTRKMPPQTPAYFASSSAFQILDPANVRTAAVYSSQNALLSGWMLGEKFINGKTALAEAKYGKGRIVLFAFRPQHRGQSWATFQLIFNALEKIG